jgi:hypothetical protein
MRRHPERVIQAHIVRLLHHVGCQVYTLGTTRRRGDYQGTMQTPGLPDVLAFLPRALGVLFVEVKAPKGRLRPEQALFRELCMALVASQVYHVTGGLDAVMLRLMQVGLLKPDQVAFYHTTLTPAQREDAQDEIDLYHQRGGRAR